MSKINVSGWKEFKVGDLINFDSSAKIYHAEHLDILDKPEDLTYYPYVVRTAFNNGIKGYIKEDPNTLNPANTISFAQDTAQLFYQDTPYFTGNKIKICTIKDHDLTKNIALFLISALLNGFDTFSYDSSFNVATLSRVKIKLPVTSTGKPDWNYMDEYIEKLATQARENVSSLAALKPVEHKIDIKAWKKFKITEWFTPLKVSHKLAKADLLTEGKYPCYSSETDNHGIAGYTNKPDFEIDDKHMYLIFGDHTRSMELAITPFSVLDNVKVLVSDKLPLNALLFIESAWHKAIPNLGYARHWSVASKTSFSLPVTSTGQPDFDYMEKYIDGVQNKAHESLELLKQI